MRNMDKEEKLRMLMDPRSQARDEYLTNVSYIVVEMDKEEKQVIVCFYKIYKVIVNSD